MTTPPQHELFAPGDTLPDDLAFERRLLARGVRRIAGTDEAGRGCLAGPVVAAAVILHPGQRIEGVTDSKAIPAERRAVLAEQIRSQALAWSVATCSPEEIDRLNILWAAMEAMRRAVTTLQPSADYVLIDGSTDIPRLGLPARTLVKGDSRSHSVAAASILAKTHRDALMLALHVEHPGFGWDSNMGYPTESHYQGLAVHGPTIHHRRSFRLSK
ncbi:MAG: ribonuclease HII [Bacteroidetes bacterium]|nr:ribonuclease HII [Bacteroidota bacterium]MDA0874835.1 ribonuclease HII [Bacteroidota bacterium]